ncbi:MAG: hypothetical protein EOL98_07945 [Negativicutes bacterium]|nr:hypothetical protein [Negativicutes bacterium]
MKKVFIKYNPYKLETDIEVDGKKLAQNSILGEVSANGTRLQEWVEKLPSMLKEEFNDTEFDLEFHGTLLDYEDLDAVFAESQKRKEIKYKILNRWPAKETLDKEVLIDDIFSKIQSGPFDELRDEEILNAFKLAKSSDFELCVVATMSAGKSTLINAMLGTKLMPSKQEACTAIITRIKDISDDVDAPFKAEVYDKDDRLSETYEKISYQDMERLNSNDSVSVIKIYGNIPFVTSEDVSLVLIDTPGPNNSRDPRHRKVQSELLGKSSKALVLYIMTGEFGTDDDNNLLKRVSESMSVGGKQSKDRFIFVVNKLDDRKKEDGDTEQTLSRVRSYLKTHGIDNPNLFPAGALPAFWIRLHQCGELTMLGDEDEFYEMETKIKKFNRNSNGSMHFENYATLPPSIRGLINSQLDKARSDWKGSEIENPYEALVHTGIISIESAIRQYVQKYAKTAKIKNIVDTFMHKLDEVGCFEETKRELASNQEHSQRIVEQLSCIRRKMADAEDAMKFKEAVEHSLLKVSNDSRELVESIIQKFQAIIRKRIDDLRDAELNVDDAEYEVERLVMFAKKLEPDFEVELDELIRKNLIITSAALLEEYKKKLVSLTEEIDAHSIGDVSIDPIKLMSGSVSMDEFSLSIFIKEKKIEDGEEWVQNTDKKWYKPWTWFQERGYHRTKYKTVRFVDGSTLAQEFFSPIQQSLSENGDAAVKFALKQSKKISERFNSEFKRLDDILKSKLTELKSYATDQKKAKERIRETERKLAWLQHIKKKVESILEI